MKVKLTDWKVEDYLKTPEERAAYIEAAVEENDPAFLAQALADVARAAGKAKLEHLMNMIAACISAAAGEGSQKSSQKSSQKILSVGGR